MKKVQGKVKVGIIGCGRIAGAHIGGILAHSDEIACVGLCDVSEANLKMCGEQLGGGQPQFKDWKQMLRDLGDGLDAVIICLPNHLHAGAVLDAAAAGKHILCEKPMCITLKEADAIAAAVRKAGVTFMSAHDQLFFPVVREAKRRIKSGELGRIRWIRSQECFRTWGLKGAWRSRLRFQGGGELIDPGYHPTYRLLHLAGSDVIGVRASMARYLQEIEGEDTASVQVRFANGVIGEILTSWAFKSPHGSHEIHVIGEKGQLFGSGSTLYFLPSSYSEPAKMDLPDVDAYTEQIEHFAGCLARGRRPLHSVEESRAVLELVLNATEDARGWQRYAAHAPAP
jgi:predicted dehydrogenase